MRRPAGDLRFLHISPILPSKSGNGLAMRASVFSEALGQLGHLSVAALGAPGTKPAHSADQTFSLSTDGRLDTVMSLIANMLPSSERTAKLMAYGVPPGAIAWSLPVVTELKKILDSQRWDAICLTRADLLVLETRYNLFPTSTPLIVDLDDDDSAYHKQLAEASSLNDHTVAEWHSAVGQVYENLIIQAAPRVAIFTCATETGATSLRQKTGCEQIFVLENSIGSVAGAKFSPSANTILFVGNLGYRPNIDGISWFLEEIWPKLRSSDVSLNLEIAGSSPSPDLRSQCHDAGAVLYPDPLSLGTLYQRAGVAIVPLRFGSGSRIKILEAGAHCVPVVSTSLGADGLGLNSTRDYFGADTASDFVEQCHLALNQRSLSRRRTDALASQIRSRFERDVSVAKLRAHIFEALAEKPLGSGPIN
jgi:glycosyltransferase involved in cell wall biosynthesis